MRDCAIFLAVHLALALLIVLNAPVAAADIPRPIELWGRLLQAVFPNVQGYSAITTFKTQAWLTLVAMWTFMPVSVWWVARGNWVLPEPNYPQLRRRPWILVVLAAVFVLLPVIFAILTPTGQEDSYSRSGRVLKAASDSPVEFGMLLGFLYSGMSIALGALPVMFRVYREVTADDAR
jgi:hypothetical protein